MSILTEITELQKQILVSKQKGDRFVRNFWSAAALFGFVAFGWIFFHSKVDTGLDNVPYYVIGLFGIIAIAILVLSDILFFNKVADMQEQLNLKLAAIAGETLGLDSKNVTLRLSNSGKQYLLHVSLSRQMIQNDKVVDETKTIPLEFKLNTASLDEVLIILRSLKDELTSIKPN